MAKPMGPEGDLKLVVVGSAVARAIAAVVVVVVYLCQARGLNLNSRAILSAAWSRPNGCRKLSKVGQLFSEGPLTDQTHKWAS